MSKSSEELEVVKPVVKVGKSYRRIDAVVLDSLNCTISTPGLKATADHLRKRGVHLADS